MIFKYIKDKNCFFGGKGPFLGPFCSAAYHVLHIPNVLMLITFRYHNIMCYLRSCRHNWRDG